MPLGSLISAGASLLGGKSQSKAIQQSNRIQARQAKKANKVAKKQHAQMVALTRAEAARQDQWSQKNLEMQREFAQQGLRWKVADAKAAGVHPLYALGANTTSFSPVSVGGVSYPGGPGHTTAGHTADTGMSDALSSAGQNIGRAVSAMQTPQERLMSTLGVERMGLENELLRAQIMATVARAGTGPGMPGGVGPDIRMFGLKAGLNPSWSDAEEFQQRYGEPAEWAVAGPIAIADLMHNYGGLTAVLNKWKQSLPQDQFRYKFFEK